MVLANTACLLAQTPEGQGGVLMVDWDLEAPGLHRYFADRFTRRFGNPETAPADLDNHPGLIDFFIALAAEIDKLPPIAEEPTPEIQEQLRRAVNPDSYILPTDVPNVFLLKAGAFDEAYAKRVNTFPWEPLYQRAPWMIPLVADWFTSRFRYTLIDSRTGITDTSGICTMLLPDKLIAVFTPNQQSLDGVLQMVERSTNYRRRSSDLRPLSVFPLPSRIEASEPEMRERWRKGANAGYQPRFEALFRKIWELDDCNLDAYFNEVQIQHASAYAYGEKVAVLLEKSNDRTSLRRAYVSFVERLALDEPWDAPAPSTTTAAIETADTAESVYASLKPAQQDAAKSLFLQLVSVTQNSLKPAARGRELKALDEPQKAILGIFVAAKVLALRENEQRETVFLADESLISAWRRFSDWIGADLEFLRWRNSLDAARADWERFGRRREGLLRGHPLTEAETWMSSRLRDFNLSEFTYVSESRRARTRRMVLTGTLGVGCGVAALAGLLIVLQLRNDSSRLKAQAILAQGGIDAAIRAERLYPAVPAVDTQLRTLLGQLPQLVAVLPDSSGAVTGMLFNQDGTRLAVNYSDHVTGYSLKSGDAPFRIPLHQAQSMTFSPEGKWLAVGDADGTRKLRNLQTGEEHSVPFGKPVTAIAFNADASRIATGTANGSIYLSTIPDTHTIHVAHNAQVSALAFSSDGVTLASGSSDGTAQVWSAATGNSLAVLQHNAPVVTVVFSRDFEHLATASSDGSAWLWLWKAEPPTNVNFPGLIGSNQRTFSPDGLSLAYVSGLYIRLLHVPSGDTVVSVSFPAQILSFAFASGNSILAVCADGAIYSSGGPAKTKLVPDDRIKTMAAGQVAFSNDGGLVAVQSNAGPIVVYQTEANGDYQSLSGSVLADAACEKLKPLSAIDPDYSKGCPAR